MTLKQETHRINVTLKGDTATKFMERLKTLRLKEIHEGSLNLTSASTLANMLITETLDIEHITQNTLIFENKSIIVDKSRASKRALIRLNPLDYTLLIEKFGDDIKKVDVSLNPCV